MIICGTGQVDTVRSWLVNAWNRLVEMTYIATDFHRNGWQADQYHTTVKKTSEKEHADCSNQAHLCLKVEAFIRSYCICRMWYSRISCRAGVLTGSYRRVATLAVRLLQLKHACGMQAQQGTATHITVLATEQLRRPGCMHTGTHPHDTLQRFAVTNVTLSRS